MAHTPNRNASSSKAKGRARRVSGTVAQISARKIGCAALVPLVLKGLPIGEMDELQTRLRVPMEILAKHLGLSKAALHRRKTTGRLGAAESERVVRLARLISRAVEVCESEEDAQRWLQSPQVGLGGAVPLDFARTEVGAREVEDLLGRIEFGVYS